MPLSDEFRQRAAECLQWAQEARTPDDQERWLRMGEFWLRLAAYAEEQEAMLRVDPSLVPEQSGREDSNGDEPTN